MHVRTKLAAALLAAGAAFAPALAATSTTAASHAAQVPGGAFVHTPASDRPGVPPLPTIAVGPRQVAGQPVQTTFTVVNATTLVRTYALADFAVLESDQAGPGGSVPFRVPSLPTGSIRTLTADGRPIAQVIVL